jgi:PiT family inorganic phosphate transporter
MMETTLFVISIVFGFYMTWNIGANDVANAMGTSVGSKALSLTKAVILAAILEFAGAFFVGGDVSETIQSGILNTSVFANTPLILALGMIASLLGTGIWLQLASYYGWPVSTTHSIIGALFGFGIIVAGPAAIHWNEIYYIVISWILSPLLGATISYLVFHFIQLRILYSLTPLKSAQRIAPWFIFGTFATFGMGLFLNGPSKLHLNFTFAPALLLSVILGGVAALISILIFRRKKADSDDEEKLLASQHDFQMIRNLNKSIKHLRRTQTYATGELEEEVTHMLKTLSAASHDTRKQLDLHTQSKEHRQVEKIFTFLQIVSACFVAFAHGANDVANAIGPLAAVLTILKTNSIIMEPFIPLWLLALGGGGIIVGLMTWGWRVIETVGKKITDLTPTRGFSAEISAAVVILLASRLGMPISTTHTLVGSVLGIGMARGIGALNLRILKDIVAAWIITIPAGAVFTIIVFYILKTIFI